MIPGSPESSETLRNFINPAQVYPHRIVWASCRSVGGRGIARGVCVRVRFLGGCSGGHFLRSVFLLKIDDGGRERLFLRKYRKSHRGQHEDRCDHDRELTEKIRGAAATEYRLARSAEGRADFRSFSRLEENRSDHKEACNDMNDNHQSMHRPRHPLRRFKAASAIVANDSVLRQAPPTSAPSISDSLSRDSAFCGVTLPPYKILMRAAVAWFQPAAMCARIVRWTFAACSVVAACPVPMAHTGS